jgi:hypothetical protein
MRSGWAFVTVSLWSLLAAGGCALDKPPVAVAPEAPAVLEQAEATYHPGDVWYSVDQRLEQYGPLARARLLPWFRAVGVAYPPERLVLVGLKHERELQVLAPGADGRLRLIRSYPVYGASGTLGPKRMEGDRQVPEGIYGIESLNPNSRFHLSLRVSYPNDYDRELGEVEGRRRLGGDIMIHGGYASRGCLAMGDAAAEELFVLAADTGVDAIEVILAPVDFRVREFDVPTSLVSEHTAVLYALLRDRLQELPREREPLTVQVASSSRTSDPR